MSNDLAVAETPITTEFQLSDDQEAARAAFVNFLISPDEQVMVLEGYAGT